MGERENGEGSRAWILGAVGCTAVAFVIAIVTDAVVGSNPAPSIPSGAGGGPSSTPLTAGASGSTPVSASDSAPMTLGVSGGAPPASGRSRIVGWVPTPVRVRRHEALPCTGPEDPINFEIFSAGSAVAGIPMTATVRRCDSAALADEAPANYVSYIYGDCEIVKGNTGCEPPLQIQTFPACQRSLADYSFEGKPLPYRELPRLGGARVVEIDFLLDNRIEVYTGEGTIVVFAADPDLARKALELLRPQESDQPPATRAVDLDEVSPARLEAPSDGALEGDLSCQS